MEQNTTNKPLRRVGTLTLGVCLIAAGTLFLLARFLPGLPWLVIWQVLPAAGLILLGCEVLPARERLHRLFRLKREAYCTPVSSASLW